MRVISFDIDLTLSIGGDHEDNAVLIAPTEISRLQGLGYIVGTCSDREPTGPEKHHATSWDRGPTSASEGNDGVGPETPPRTIPPPHRRRRQAGPQGSSGSRLEPPVAAGLHSPRPVTGHLNTTGKSRLISTSRTNNSRTNENRPNQHQQTRRRHPHQMTTLTRLPETIQASIHKTP